MNTVETWLCGAVVAIFCVVVLIGTASVLRSSHTKPCDDKPGSTVAFAQEIMELMRAQGETRALRFDSANDRLLVGGEGERLSFANLSAIRTEFCSAAETERSEVLRRFVAVWIANSPGNEAVPTDLAQAGPHLLPMIRPRITNEAVRLGAQIDGDEDPHVAAQTLADHLTIGIAYDKPESLVYVSQDNLDAWKTNFDDVLAVALANLRSLSSDSFRAVAPGVWAGPWADNYGPSRLLIGDRLRALVKEGDPVVLVPNRDTILIASSTDADALCRMAALADEAFKTPRRLSGAAIRLDGSRWVPFLPGEKSPAYAMLHRLLLNELSETYATQKQLLDELNTTNDVEVFVATFSVKEATPTARATSFSVWTKGVHTWLPHTENVLLIDPSLEGTDKLVASGRWEDVIAILGKAAKPLDGYPPRWEVTEFPPPEQLKAIGRLPAL